MNKKQYIAPAIHVDLIETQAMRMRYYTVVSTRTANLRQEPVTTCGMMREDSTTSAFK